MARHLGRLLPAVAATMVLDPTGDVMASGPGEATGGDNRRHAAATRMLAADDPRQPAAGARPGQEVIVSQIPISDLRRPPLAVPEVPTKPNGRSTADTSETAKTDGWIALPPTGSARWYLPVGSRRVAEAALHLYQPTNPSALVAWQLGRALARTGALRALPRTEAPELVATLLPHVPRDGTMAVAMGRYRHRAVAMLLGADDRPVAIAKVALDERGRASLAEEAAAHRRFVPMLEPPLAAPALLDEADGVLIFEPLDWTPRLRPWRLSEDLAAGIGRFHRTQGGSAGLGLSHGDFAPWNVFRSGDRWMLIDWENASDSGVPFEDPFHYVVEAHALLGRPSQADILGAATDDGWVGRAFRAYAGAAGLSMDGLQDRLVEHLVTTKAMFDPGNPAHFDDISARQGLLAELGRTAAATVADPH